MPTASYSKTTRNFASATKKASQLRVFVCSHAPQTLSIISSLRIIKRASVSFEKRDSFRPLDSLVCRLLVIPFEIKEI